MVKSKYIYSKFYLNKTDKPETPRLISVIVIAHDRKNFILYAINSIFHQTLERSKYEVIVVKNFKDDVIDEVIYSYGYTNLFTTKVNLGDKLIMGLQNSSGDIITFLEDDDVFFKDRLRVILSIFSDSSINYFHNVFIECDIDLRPVLKQKFPQINHTNIVCESKFNSRFLNWAISHSIQSNLSSIAIKRSVFESIIEILKASNGGEDLSIFLQCCRISGCIFMSSIPLTHVRIHNSFFTTYNSNTLTDIIAFRIQRNKAYLRTYYLNLMTNNNTKPIVQWLNSVIIYRDILNQILEQSDNSVLNFKKYIFSSFYCFKHKNFKKFITTLLSLVLYILDKINKTELSNKIRKAIANLYF